MALGHVDKLKTMAMIWRSGEQLPRFIVLHSVCFRERDGASGTATLLSVQHNLLLSLSIATVLCGTTTSSSARAPFRRCEALPAHESCGTSCWRSADASRGLHHAVLEGYIQGSFSPCQRPSTSTRCPTHAHSALRTPISSCGQLCMCDNTFPAACTPVGSARLYTSEGWRPHRC